MKEDCPQSVERVHRIIAPRRLLIRCMRELRQLLVIARNRFGYAFMAPGESHGGLGAGLSVERVQKLHRESETSIGVRVQILGVSGAVAC